MDPTGLRPARARRRAAALPGRGGASPTAAHPPVPASPHGVCEPSLPMPHPLRARLERDGILERDLAQPLGLELLLRQGHAAVKHLRVAADASALKIEPTNAIECHAPTLGLRTRRLEAEAITCITGMAAER